MPVNTAVPGSPVFSISVFSAVAGATPRPCRFTSAMPVVYSSDCPASRSTSVAISTRTLLVPGSL